MRVYPKYHQVPTCYHTRERSNHEPDRSSHPTVKNNKNESTPSFVICIDDAVPIEITNAVYHYTTQTNRPHTTWGTYITMSQIQQYWRRNHNEHHHDDDTTNLEESKGDTESDQDPDLNAIAVPAAAYFMKHYVNRSAYPNLFRDDRVTSSSSSTSLDTNEPLTSGSDHGRDPSTTDPSIVMDAHGIAIWALASEIGSEVPYHMDYAELLRYETGMIVPPILAGTWHCTNNQHHSPHASFRGGDYCVVARGNGFDHYQKHGYKGKLLTPVVVLRDTGTAECHESNEILRIPYQFNRMICQSGHLPHWSTRVEAPIPVDTGSDIRSVSEGGPKKVRVIVGFNVFLPDVGPIIQQAPEHSEAFRRRVKDRKGNQRNLSLQACTTNPQLRRLLVLAKRQKHFNNFKQAQSDLEEQMQRYIKSMGTPVTVGQLLDEFTPSHNTNQWPFDASDVLVHIHNACKKGTLRVTGTDSGDHQLTKLIRKDLYVECCSNKQDDRINHVNEVL